MGSHVQVNLCPNVALDVALPFRRLPHVVHEDADGYGSSPCFNHVSIQLTDEFLDMLSAAERERRFHSRSHRVAHFRGRPPGGMSVPRTPSSTSNSASSSRSVAVA